MRLILDPNVPVSAVVTPGVSADLLVSGDADLLGPAGAEVTVLTTGALLDRLQR